MKSDRAHSDGSTGVFNAPTKKAKQLAPKQLPIYQTSFPSPTAVAGAKIMPSEYSPLTSSAAQIVQ
jgi:hypothetical protein